MKPIYRQPADQFARHRPSVMTVHSSREDEVVQEQMRRLHNARASRRAVQHQRRASAI
jgi:hypothetical protein